MVSVPSSASRARSLMPAEHGAYGEIGFPIATSLCLALPTLSAGALVLAAIALFVAHEPLLVLLGHRGARVRVTEARRARRWLAVLGAAAVTLGITGLVTMAAPVRALLLIPVALVLALAPLVALGRERTALGEILAATALSSAGIPIAAAAGVSTVVALTMWIVWSVAFSLSTLAVRASIARARSGEDGARSGLVAAASAASLLFTTALAASRGWSPVLPLGMAPLAAFSIGLHLFPHPPRRLRTLGWTLVAASFVTFAVLVLLA